MFCVEKNQKKIFNIGMTEIQTLIATPNMSFLLLVFGIYGIFLEMLNPGAIMPGIFGALCLMLAIFGLGFLPVNYTGAWLITIGFLLIIGEAFLPTFGIFALIGAFVFAIGGSRLIDKEVYGSGVSLWVIFPITLITLAIILYAMSLFIKSRNTPVATGAEALKGSVGKIVNWSHGKGDVLVAGSHWQAYSETDYLLKQDDEIIVKEINGLKLLIEPIKKQEN